MSIAHTKFQALDPENQLFAVGTSAYVYRSEIDRVSGRGFKLRFRQLQWVPTICSLIILTPKTIDDHRHSFSLREWYLYSLVKKIKMQVLPVRFSELPVAYILHHPNVCNLNIEIETRLGSSHRDQVGF